jgi:hypothetical protein
MRPLNGDKFTIGVLLAVLLILLLMWVFKAEGAAAAPICGLTSSIEGSLAVHGEVESAKGPTVGGGLMRLFVTPSGSTWSLIVTLGNGRSCLVDAGSDWALTVSRKGSL